MHANSETQSCFPAYPRIMEMSGIGRRNTVIKYIRIMEKNKLIEVLRNNKRQPNIYFLLHPTNIKLDRPEIDTVKNMSSQNEQSQYVNSNAASIETDTLNHITNSDKEMNGFGNKEGLKKLKDELERLRLSKGI
jgi:hypothetical protein